MHLCYFASQLLVPPQKGHRLFPLGLVAVGRKKLVVLGLARGVHAAKFELPAAHSCEHGAVAPVVSALGGGGQAVLVEFELLPVLESVGGEGGGGQLEGGAWLVRVSVENEDGGRGGEEGLEVVHLTLDVGEELVGFVDAPEVQVQLLMHPPTVNSFRLPITQQLAAKKRGGFTTGLSRSRFVSLPALWSALDSYDSLDELSASCFRLSLLTRWLWLVSSTPTFSRSLSQFFHTKCSESVLSCSQLFSRQFQRPTCFSFCCRLYTMPLKPAVLLCSASNRLNALARKAANYSRHFCNQVESYFGGLTSLASTLCSCLSFAATSQISRSLISHPLH